MGDLAALAGDYTLRTVALGAAVLGLLGGTLGTFAVLRRQSLLSDALAHATLPGVVLGFLLTGTTSGSGPMLGAGATAALAAGLVLVVVQRTRVKQDAALALVLSVFFGAGTVLLTYVAGTGASGQSGLDRFVLGQAASLVAADVRAMAALTGVALAVVAVAYKELKLVAFDPAFARAVGYPVRRVEALLTVLLVVAIVVGIQTVGVVLVAALLITPAAAARQWTDRLPVMIVLAALIGALSGVTGAVLSATATDLPTGPLVVLVATALLVLSLPARRVRGRRGARRAPVGERA
ncbi:manganese/zinc/iron transport system permease protein [Georgenia satyanarayanai]|uniref:Manganese/zinc/iron transport system permease protein n=1 Tax=Georgenia satyanarayanai TaxID=860221 RepID=A0A2Y9AJ32_9MICO|nr:iron chelate uptake ABC transporter family permease subunit [Georgenia satyanarayanai]PYF99160.1 manganese/zinc/iron transport system permease protein [Georgenia satyanarayanai]SSA43278.1 manganese/zinc/iron transport system permease protein [Georgenia satyanarayanai]